MGQKDNIDDILELLTEVSEDRTVPRNIRGTATSAIGILKEKNKDSDVKASEAIALLDEIATDLNMPVHARTKIWNIVGMLEAVQT